MKKILLSLMLLMGMSLSLDAGDFEDYSKACDGGYATGCYNLGLRYEFGKGVKQDDFKAMKYYTKACDCGYAGGCFSLGSMHEFGRGVKQSYSKAKKLYEKTCDGGEAAGCKNYARLNKR